MLSPLLGIVLFIIVVLVLSSLFTVKQQTAYIIERLGKFIGIRHAGLHFKVPFIDRISGRVNLKIQQLDVLVETKTKDNVFVKVKVSVQFEIEKDKVSSAFYKLQNPHSQITSYVFDVVRAEVPKLILDDVFLRKDDIAVAVKRELQESMLDYGYTIIKTLVTDIDPDEQVKHAMNRINSAEREKVAAQHEAEADRIRIVAKAKAEAESKQLQGKGIADQRREIARGLEDSVKILKGVNINPQEASSLIVVTQHYDTLSQVGARSNSNLVLLPNNPSAATDMLSNMVTSFSAAQKMNDTVRDETEE